MTPRRLFAVATVAIVLLGVHALLAGQEATVRVVNEMQSSHVLIEVDDTWYQVPPGNAAGAYTTGLLIHHVTVFDGGCGELASFDAWPGNYLAVTVTADGSVSMGNGPLAPDRMRTPAMARPWYCPASGLSLELVLRDALLLVAAASAVLALGLLVRRRTAGTKGQALGASAEG